MVSQGAEDEDENVEGGGVGAGKKELEEEAPFFQQLVGGGGSGEESGRQQVLLLPGEVVRQHDCLRGRRLPDRVVPLRVRGNHSRAQGQVVLQDLRGSQGKGWRGRGGFGRVKLRFGLYEVDVRTWFDCNISLTG